ncbi:MAG: PAS domain S-box protein [Paracoccaceae bacterium]|nr:PAS domain S-box protein [Paracoccaceae bacterium]
MSYDLEGRIVTWNQAAADLYGYSADEIIGQSMEVLYPDDWPFGVLHYRDLILAGELEECEVIHKTKQGDLRHVAVTAAPVLDADGAVTSISNFHRDVTQAKAAEENLQVLTRELSHRTKNLLAVVAAIERQTAQGSKTIDEFHDKFSNRIQSLVESDRLLSEIGWAPVKFDHLARAQLAVFAADPENAADISGPDITLLPQAVQLIGLSLHELGTNAVKYGALSGCGGHIRLSWGIEAGSLKITWTEISTGIEGPPEHTGMGHQVVTNLAARSLEAEAVLDFAPGSLTWEITIPSKFFQ